MSDSTGPSVSRRDLLRAGAGATAGTVGVAAATGTAAAQEGGGGGGGTTQPDFGGFLDGVDGGFTDARGQSEVTVKVGASGNTGNYAFAPAGLWVDPGTKVQWEWTGEGGAHNVAAVEGADFRSGDPISESGVHFEHTFDSGGIVDYHCEPHASLGMKGAVAVGNSVPTKTVAGEYVSVLPNSAKTIGIATVGALASVLGLSYIFLRYGGNYEEQVE